jgi:hypothetical protein
MLTNLAAASSGAPHAQRTIKAGKRWSNPSSPRYGFVVRPIDYYWLPNTMNRRISQIVLALALAAGLSGCFYPPLTQPPRPEQRRVRIAKPFDMTWDATLSVLKENNYKVQAQDSNHGIIEAHGTSFTLDDADCGKIRNLVGTVPVEPTKESSAVYNFRLKPDGPEATFVSVETTFVTPLRVPFHPPRNTECVSRGADESRLLSEIEGKAAEEQRPKFLSPH